MFTIKIADLYIAIDNKFSFVETLCTKYKCIEKPDFTVSVSLKEIDAERSVSTSTFDDGYLESVCIYRHIAENLPKFNAFVMHGAVIEYNGNAYCFAAKSGTGKTTHILLWQKLFGDKINIINGDKPIIRLINNKLYAFGTPWCGKENLGSNSFAPLNGVCFLDRSKVNTINELSAHEALNRVLHHIYFPKNSEYASMTIDLIGKMLSNTHIWRMECNISDEAAIMSFNTMCKKDKI